MEWDLVNPAAIDISSTCRDTVGLQRRGENDC